MGFIPVSKRTGIFDIELSDIIREAFDIRSDSDYDDYYLISKEDVMEQIQNAESFYQKINPYLMQKKP